MGKQSVPIYVPRIFNKMQIPKGIKMEIKALIDAHEHTWQEPTSLQ